MPYRPPPTPVPIDALDLSVPAHCGFSEHPNRSQQPTERFSVDLDQEAKLLIAFLDSVFGSRVKMGWSWYSERQMVLSPLWLDRLIDPQNAEQLLGRYSRFLQLKARYPTHFLVPTLDIELVWQSHMLRPDYYWQDLGRLGMAVGDHQLLLGLYESNVKKEALRRTALLWEDMFGEPYLLPYVDEAVDLEESRAAWDGQAPVDSVDYSAVINEAFSSLHPDQQQVAIPAHLAQEQPKPALRMMLEMAYSHRVVVQKSPRSHAPNLTSLRACDVVKDYEWFSNLAEDLRGRGGHADLPRVRKGYERFLFLLSKHGEAVASFFHPSYEIDVMWHAHMLRPHIYQADTRRLVGFDVVHLPWPKPGDQMMEDGVRSQQIWDALYPAETLEVLPKSLSPPPRPRPRPRDASTGAEIETALAAHEREIVDHLVDRANDARRRLRQ